ncbi:GNAT family N-acetyltransferase [Fusobacteria bacterium ZRK30]|nr:GNAT family N-acetyltransferase [Fusobacteria bacterium ZRK30]
MKKYNLKNKKNYLIREITPEDAKNFITYRTTLADETTYMRASRSELNLNLEDQDRSIENFINYDNQYSIVAELDEIIIGNLQFRGGNRQRTKHAGEFGISVLKDYWGNRIGYNLLSHLIEWVKDNKAIKKINLEVREDNKSAIALYKKLGFELEGTIRKNFFADGKYYDSHVMGMTFK